MRLPNFDYHAPLSLSEALGWLSEHKTEGIRILAGGTDLLVDLRSKIIPDSHRPRCQQHRAGGRSASVDQYPEMICLMSITQIDELRGISLAGRRLHIGALTTIAELERSPVVRELATGLYDGAAQLGSPLVRNRGTYGGNICNARPAADTAIPTLALGGKLVLASPRGERIVDHSEFVTGPGTTILAADEILKEIMFDIPDRLFGSAYIKLANRKALEISMVGAAAAVVFDLTEACVSRDRRQLTVESARIALGAVAPKPLLASDAGEYLAGKLFSQENIAEAAQLAARQAKPITDHRGSAQYRRMMVETLVRRALTICRERALSGITEKAST